MDHFDSSVRLSSCYSAIKIATLKPLNHNPSAYVTPPPLLSSDYFLRPSEHVGWDRQAQLLGGLEIDREFDILNRLDLEIFGMSPAENFLDVLGGNPPDLIVVLAVARERAIGDHTLLVEHGR